MFAHTRTQLTMRVQLVRVCCGVNLRKTSCVSLCSARERVYFYKLNRFLSHAQVYWVCPCECDATFLRSRFIVFPMQ